MKDIKEKPTIKKKRISVQSAKSKGRSFQQWIGKKFSEIVGIPFGKDCLIASREMGQSGTDIRLVGEAQEIIPYSIEAKRCENWGVPSWIEQAQSNQLKNTDWLLFAKRSHKKAVVIMDAEVFFRMFKENHNAKKTKKTSTRKTIKNPYVERPESKTTIQERKRKTTSG